MQKKHRWARIKARVDNEWITGEKSTESPRSTETVISEMSSTLASARYSPGSPARTHTAVSTDVDTHERYNRCLSSHGPPIMTNMHTDKVTEIATEESYITVFPDTERHIEARHQKSMGHTHRYVRHTHTHQLRICPTNRLQSELGGQWGRGDLRADNSSHSSLTSMLLYIYTSTHTHTVCTRGGRGRQRGGS